MNWYFICNRCRKKTPLIEKQILHEKKRQGTKKMSKHIQWEIGKIYIVKSLPPLFYTKYHGARKLFPNKGFSEFFEFLSWTCRIPNAKEKNNFKMCGPKIVEKFPAFLIFFISTHPFYFGHNLTNSIVFFKLIWIQEKCGLRNFFPPIVFWYF